MDRELISTVSARSSSPPLWSVFFLTADVKENNQDPALQTVVLQSSAVDVNVCFRAEDLDLARKILRWIEALPLAIQKSLRTDDDERERAWRKETKTVEVNRLADLLEKGNSLLNRVKETERFHRDSAALEDSPPIEGYAYCFLRDDFIEADWLAEYFDQNRSSYFLSHLLAAWCRELDVIANRCGTENLGRACQALGVLTSIDSVTDALRLVETFAKIVHEEYPTGVATEEFLRREARLWTGANNLRPPSDCLVWKFRQSLIHH